MNTKQLARQWQEEQRAAGNLVECPKHALISKEMCRIHAAMSQMRVQGTRGKQITGKDHRWGCGSCEHLPDELPDIKSRLNNFRWGKDQGDYKWNGKRIKSYIMKVLNNGIIPTTSNHSTVTTDNEGDTGERL